METQHDFGAVSPESSVNICSFQSLCFNPPAVALQRREIVFCDRKKPGDHKTLPKVRSIENVKVSVRKNRSFGAGTEPHTHRKQGKDAMDLPAGH